MRRYKWAPPPKTEAPPELLGPFFFTIRGAGEERGKSRIVQEQGGTKRAAAAARRLKGEGAAQRCVHAAEEWRQRCQSELLGEKKQRGVGVGVGGAAS